MLLHTGDIEERNFFLDVLLSLTFQGKLDYTHYTLSLKVLTGVPQNLVALILGRVKYKSKTFL